MPEPLPGDAVYAKQYRDEFDKRMAEFITRGALRDPSGQFRQRLFNAAAPGMLLEQTQGQRRTTRTSVDAKGRR